MLDRRSFITSAGCLCLAARSRPLLRSLVSLESGSMRCINVVNFIRGVEPRFATDLLLPVQKQMELILQHRLPATWLLQFDALVSGPFVAFLKAHMAANHEVGFWFEMNEMLCREAAVDWRGRPGYEWDHLPPVAFTIGYSPVERIKLADAAMLRFKSIWGKYPLSVASWNLDSITMAHLTDRYKIDAYAVCRDQIATDGFTIWGAPIAGYYPSKTNCWSPALSRKNQIDTPVFRLLGQDPVHYYSRGFKLPDGKVVHEPDTMEPVWTSGKSPRFVKAFLDMISAGPSLRFAYAQLGQENSFPWLQMADAYPAQMAALAHLRDAKVVHVETMGESGRRFKAAFKTTPTQSQVMLGDPYETGEATIWYQSRFYRANLHIKDGVPFLRDISVYSDHNQQPYLDQATRQNDVEQRMPAVLDGYHWSRNPGSLEEVGAGGFMVVGGERLRLSGKPSVVERGDALVVDLPLHGGKTLHVRFEEESITLSLASLSLSFEWDDSKGPSVNIEPQRVNYRFNEFEYLVKIARGLLRSTPKGWSVNESNGEIVLSLAQTTTR